MVEIKDTVKNALWGAYKGLATKFTAELKESKFLDEGKLMISEFILAGDNLTHKCPTWE